MRHTYSGLCICGPRAGFRVAHDEPSYRVEVPRNLPTVRSEPPSSQVTERETVIYRFVTGIHADDFREDFWIPEGQTTGDALRQVFSVYASTAMRKAK